MMQNSTHLGNSSSTGLPEAQRRLQTALETSFSSQLFTLPAHAWKEFGLTYGVNMAEAKVVFQRLRDEPPFLFNMLIDITCVDWLDRREPRFDVVYQLLSLSHLHRLCLKIHVNEEHPEVDSVRDLWPTANFLEREVWDMYGVCFKGHGDLRRILMYDEFVGHPLRKDYPVRGKQPRVPLRIPELRNDSADMFRDDLVALPRRKGTAPNLPLDATDGARRVGEA